MRRAASCARAKRPSAPACPRRDRSASSRSTSSTPPRRRSGSPPSSSRSSARVRRVPSGSTPSSRSPASTGSSARSSKATIVDLLRAGNDLVLEEYLDGVEFDIDLVLEDGECVFSSVSQNWPTAEPSFQETGLHCPPDHARSRSAASWSSACGRSRRSGSCAGVLHVEGKCTAKGPRIVEVNARMGGGRIHQIVEAVWGVDLIEAHLRSALGLPQQLAPSRKPRCAVVDALLYAPATGRLAALPFREVTSRADLGPSSTSPLRWGRRWTGPIASSRRCSPR